MEAVVGPGPDRPGAPGLLVVPVAAGGRDADRRCRAGPARSSRSRVNRSRWRPRRRRCEEVSQASGRVSDSAERQRKHRGAAMRQTRRVGRVEMSGSDAREPPRLGRNRALPRDEDESSRSHWSASPSLAGTARADLAGVLTPLINAHEGDVAVAVKHSGQGRRVHPPPGRDDADREPHQARYPGRGVPPVGGQDARPRQAPRASQGGHGPRLGDPDEPLPRRNETLGRRGGASHDRLLGQHGDEPRPRPVRS